MNYRLNEKDGKVAYLTRMNKTAVGGETARESAEWILEHGKPEKSGEFEGYPIAVKMNGNEYFFSGEWIEPHKPQKRRRIKDVVCE